MSRRLIIAGVALAALGGAAVPAALASSGGGLVTVDTSNGVRVGVQKGTTPIAGASVTPGGQACVGISLELPVCTPGGIVQTRAQSGTRQTGPVTVRRDQYGTTVGVTADGAPVASATVYNNGQVCAGISLQLPVCVGVVQTRAQAGTAQSLPVQVRHDDQATGVSVGDVGVVRYSDGEICPIVSTQDWRCVQGPAK